MGFFDFLKPPKHATIFGSIVQRTAKVAEGVTGISEVQAAVKDYAGTKNFSDALRRLPGAIVGAPLSQISDVAEGIAGNRTNIVTRDLGAINSTAVNDPTDSLKVLGGAVGIVGGVVTANPAAIAAGAVTAAAGGFAIVEKSGVLSGHPVADDVQLAAQQLSAATHPPIQATPKQADAQGHVAAAAVKAKTTTKTGFFARVEDWFRRGDAAIVRESKKLRAKI